MPDLTREQVISALENGWGTYVARFHALSPEAQATFLRRQGYARLADLLAHVVAWWEEGCEAIARRLSDPAFESPDHDVDEFNARAVAASRHLDEAAIVQRFEAQRQAMLQLARTVPASALQSERIAGRFHIEVIGHLQEHEIRQAPEGQE